MVKLVATWVLGSHAEMRSRSNRDVGINAAQHLSIKQWKLKVFLDAYSNQSTYHKESSFKRYIKLASSICPCNSEVVVSFLQNEGRLFDSNCGYFGTNSNLFPTYLNNTYWRIECRDFLIFIEKSRICPGFFFLFRSHFVVIILCSSFSFGVRFTLLT